MDKIKLTMEDVDRLIEWRDNNKELVRRCPAPLTEIEIFAPSGVHFKAFRKGDTVSFHVFFNKKKLGKVDLKILYKWTKVMRNTLNFQSKDEMVQDLISTYASLMAYMTYEKRYVEAQPRTTAVHRTGATRNRKKGVTYILHMVSNRKGTGHHASPAHAFMVRGHYRHYKSGKTVWVAPFKKGEGDVKDKNYKI